VTVFLYIYFVSHENSIADIETCCENALFDLGNKVGEYGRSNVHFGRRVAFVYPVPPSTAVVRDWSMRLIFYWTKKGCTFFQLMVPNNCKGNLAHQSSPLHLA